MEVWPNAYYNYIKDSKREYRENKVKIQRRMVEIYHENGGIPGYRMLRDYLAMEGTKISNPTAWKYANELSLRSIVRRKKYEYLGGKKDHIFPNLVNREFKADAPNKVWCTDFTYMKDPETKEKYYNCTIIDLFRREAVATLNGPEITAELAKAALDIAVQKRQPEKGLILHSNQGVQYASSDFQKHCLKYGIQQSMSAAGCPYDNAPMERFYNTFKNEFYNHYKFNTRADLDKRTYEFVYVKYNQKRPHRYNKGLPPVMVA